MGTITRNFANNLTTSGLLKPTAFNNDSFDNVTAVPSGSVETGAMQFISSVTASASASIEFTSGIDSTYKEYVFYYINMHPANNAVGFQFNLSTDGGSTYNVTKTSTYFGAYHDEADITAALGYFSGEDLAQSTSNQNLLSGVGNGSDESGSGYLHLFNPSSTTFVKHFISRGNNINQSGDYCWSPLIAGYGNTTSAINAVKFQMSSGNIDAGQILLFGIN